MKTFVLALLMVTFACLANADIVSGTWKGGNTEVSISNKKVVLNGIIYPVGKVEVSKAHVVNSTDFFSSWTSVECRISTRSAYFKDGKIVLVEAGLSKNVSGFGAFTCSWTRSAEGFDNPYMFHQIVLRQSSDGLLMTLQGINVTDSLDRPNLSITDLENPSLAESLRTSRTTVENQVLTKMR